MAITAGQQALASDFVSTSAGSGDSGKVPKLDSDGKLDPSFVRSPVTHTYTTTPTVIGDSTTQFDITNPSGTTFRYTYDGTGTDPALSAANNPVGSVVSFWAQNFSSGNNGTFVVTGSGANYVEVTNASGVAENNKTLGTGYASRASSSLVWAKPTGLSHVIVEVVGGGGKGGDCSSSSGARPGGGGGGGGYARKIILADDLPSSVGVEVCPAGTASVTVSARRSSFGATIYALGGESKTSSSSAGEEGGSGGVASGGDVNAPGSDGGSCREYVSGYGGCSPLGGSPRGRGQGSSGSYPGYAGKYYGAGGGGALCLGSTSATGGDGYQGVVIVTEIY